MAKSTGKPIATSKPSKLMKKTDSDDQTVAKKEFPMETAETSKGTVSRVASENQPDGADDKIELTIEKKLIALYTLQQVHSQIDKIRIIRGELPLEVQDLEDDIAGLETRVDNYIQETVSQEKAITDKRTAIKDSQALIKNMKISK